MGDLIQKRIVVSGQNYPVFNIPGRPPAMLDMHLAEIYEVDTKYLNRIAKRNRKKFFAEEGFVGQDYCYILNEEETKEISEILGNKFCFTPYMYTREGCNMVATILTSDVAITRSVEIVQGFTNVERIGAMVLPEDDRAFFAMAMVRAQKIIGELEQQNVVLVQDNQQLQEDKVLLIEDKEQVEREKKQVEEDRDRKQKHVAYLQAVKDVRVTEALIKSCPHRVKKHYNLPSVQLAHDAIYREWRYRYKTCLYAMYHKAKGKSRLTLYDFLIRNDLAKPYLQLVEGMLANESRGRQTGFSERQAEFF